MFCVLYQTDRNLLCRSFKAAFLNYVAGILDLAHPHQKPRREQPELPLDIVWAAHHCVGHVADRLLEMTQALMHLIRFNEHFPLKFLIHVVVHVVQNGLDVVKSLAL